MSSIEDLKFPGQKNPLIFKTAFCKKDYIPVIKQRNYRGKSPASKALSAYPK